MVTADLVPVASGVLGMGLTGLAAAAAYFAGGMAAGGAELQLGGSSSSNGMYVGPMGGALDALMLLRLHL